MTIVARGYPSISATVRFRDREVNRNVCGPVGNGNVDGCHAVEVGTGEETRHTDRIRTDEHIDHQDEDPASGEMAKSPNGP